MFANFPLLPIGFALLFAACVFFLVLRGRKKRVVVPYTGIGEPRVTDAAPAPDAGNVAGGVVVAEAKEVEANEVEAKEVEVKSKKSKGDK